MFLAFYLNIIICLIYINYVVWFIILYILFYNSECYHIMSISANVAINTK